MALGSTQPLIFSKWQKRPLRAANNLHVPIVMESGCLNFLEPSGPVQVSTWIALLLPLPLPLPLPIPTFYIAFIQLLVCLTTGPKPLPKRALFIVRSKAPSFK